ncbi:hypothetical protein QBC35DRAFT_552565 [Podospora australis]|uniref:Uncharacterized protein n=1 Tax=Podospora australis TaxID=1536484 RepID=A0AAN7AIG3_9PEZI|nr:hypothetical protein QBC35DRAFT_552565 [Podospora australis]
MRTATVTFAMFLAGCMANLIKLAQPEKFQVVDIEIGHAGSEEAVAKSDAEVNHRHMTYYGVSLGACGHDDSGKGTTDNIVAVLSALMSGQGVGEACGRTISIKANGKETTAVVRGKCPSCPAEGIDISEKVFMDLIGDLGVGRTEVSWAFVEFSDQVIFGLLMACFFIHIFISFLKENLSGRYTSCYMQSASRI